MKDSAMPRVAAQKKEIQRRKSDDPGGVKTTIDYP